jgi:hypothetical protein
MQSFTINSGQLNAVFGVAMPIIVAIVAGLVRQDRFPGRVNDCISYAVIIVLAIIQTWLGGQFGGSVGNFLLVAAWSIAGLHTRYGQDFQGSIQTATSIGKLPPEPPQLPTVHVNVEMLAALLLAELQKMQQPVDQQPTQSLQVVRENTPPPPQGG